MWKSQGKAMRRFSDYSVRRKESGCSFPKSVSVDELRKKLTAGEVRVAGSVSGDIIKCRRKSHNARRVSWSLASTEISDADFPSYKFGNCLINPKHGDVLTNTGSGDKIFQKLSDENKAVKVAGSETDCDLGTNVIRNNEDRCDNETNLDKTQESEPDSDAEISGILANSDNYPLLAINAVNKVCPSVVTCGSCQKKSKPTSDVLVVRDKTKANVTRRSPEDGTDTIVPKYVDELERDLILGKMTKKKSEITFDQRRTSRDESKSLNLSDDVLILEQSKEPIYMNIFEERNKKLSIFEDLSEPVKTYLSRHLSCGENLDESGASETSFSRRNDSHVSGYEQEETMYRKYGDRDIKRKISEGVVPRKKSESLIKTVLKDSLTRKLSEGSRRGTASRKTSRENSRKLSEGSRRGTACRKTSREMNLEEVSGKFIDWKTLRSKTRMRKLSDTGAVHPVVEPVYANIPVNRGTELLPYRQMKYAPISSSGKAAGLASELTGDKDFVTRKMSEGLSPRKLSENLMQPLIQHSMKRKLSVGNVNRPDNYHGQFQMEIKAIEMKGNHSAGFEASYGTKQVFSKQVKGGKSIYPDQPSQDFKGAMTASTVRDVPKMYPCKGKSVARELTYGRDFGIRQPPASRLTRKSSERTTSQVVDALNTRDWPGDRNRSRVRSDSVDCRVSSNSCKRMTSPVVDNYERTTSPVVDEYERMTSPVVDDLNTRELSGDRSRIRSVTGEATRSRNTYERMMNPVVDDLNTRELSGDRSRSRIRSVIGEARMSRNSYERMIRPAVDDLNTSDLPGNSSETRVGSVSGEGRLSRKSSEQMFRPVVDELITRELSWDRSRLRSVSREGRRSRNSYDRMTSSVVDDLNTRELSGDRSRSRIRSVIGEAKMSRNSYERMIRPAVDDLNTSDLPGNSSETRVGSVSGEGRLSRKSSEQMFRPVVDELITRELSWDRSRLRSVSREGRASGNSFDRMTSPVVDDLNTRELSGDRSRIRSVTGEARSINSYERMFRPMVDELITRDSPGDRSETTRFRSVSWECGVSRNSYERMTSPVRDDLNTRELPRDRSKTRIRTVSGEARKSSERMTRPAVDDLDTRDLLGDSCRSRFRSVSREGGVSRSSYERMTRPVVDDSVFGEMAGANQRTGRVRSVSEDICRKKVSVRDLIRVFSGELETTTNSSEAVLRTPAVHSGKVTLNRFSPLIRHKFEKPRKVTSITRSSSLSPGLRKKKKSVGFLLDNSPEREFIKYPTVQNRYENTVTPVLDRRYKKLSGEARRRKTGVGLVSTNSEAGYMDMQTPLRSPVIQTNPENNEWLTWKSGPGWESPRMLRSRKICAPLGMLVRTMSGNSLTDRKKPMHFENCSAFGGSSTSGTLTSTDSNRSNKDVRNNGTLTSTDSNRSRSQLSQLDVFGFVQKPLEIPLFSEKPISSRSASSSDLRQISLNERLTKTHQIWNLPEVGRIGAVHLLKDRDIGMFIVRKSSQPNTMALSIQFPDKDGQPNVDHYLIECFGNKQHLQGSARMFDDVPSLLAFYCENREDLPHCLTLPLAIRRAKTSQELAALGMLGQAFWTSAKYEGSSRASSRTNLSELSSVINKSASEPISIVQKSSMAAYNQSETLVQNSPPKHSVIDFSSYLIQKKSEKMEVTECTKSANNLSESVQTKCSLSEMKQRNVVNSHMTSSFHQSTASANVSTHVINHDHVSSHMTDNVISGSNHMTCSTFYQHEKERKLSETVLHNVQKDVDLNLINRKSKSVINRDPKPMVPYAKPKKGKSNLYFTTSIDLLNLPQDTYFTSNLSDKLSDYEDIWKTTGSVYGVGSVQADIVSRLQPNLINNNHTNNSIENSPVKEPLKSSEKEIEYFDEHKHGEEESVIDEKEVFKDSGTEIEESVEINDSGDKLLCEFCLCTDEQCPQCGSLETEGLPVTETSLHDDSNENDICDIEVLDKEITNFEPIPEQESDIESDMGASEGCHSDDHDADTEDCDYSVSAKNTVHTQTSPVVKSIPPPLSNVCRKSTSTPELLALKSPVYAEPFDAINAEPPTENVPKVPKKMRRRSAPSFGAYKRKLGTSQPPKLTPISSGLEVKRNSEELRQCVHEEFTLEERDDDHCLRCNHSSKEKKFKPTPNPRKTKSARSLSQKSDNSTPNRKCVNDVVNRLEKLKIRNTQSISETNNHNVQAVDPVRIMEDFESTQCLSSPTLQKFPVYIKQFSGASNKTGYSENTTAEDIISSWNPELTLQPFKPFPIMIPGAMSEYDNLNSTGYNYLDPSSQSLASAGTIFCKPWENSTLGKLMHTHNQFSPKAKSSAPNVAPPPLPAMDMHERIKAWQESSQVYQSVPTDAEEEYMKSAVSDINSVEAKTFGGDGLSMSEVKVSTAGQPSQCNKTPANEKKTKQQVEERTEENFQLFGADFREKILPVLANPRLLRHTAHNRQPDTKIREYIIRLSQDRGTTFGSTIENFIQCTLDSHETNPFIVTRNVRQFMNGIKNYLVKHGEGELEDLIERERTKLESDEILNIDAILENALHVCVLQPLKQDIYRLFVNEYTRNGNLKLLSSNIKYARTKTPEEIGIRKGLSPPDMPTLESIKHFLSKMQKSYSPVKKLENLLCATSTIYKWVASRQIGNGSPTFGADDFLPVLIYVLVQCGMVSVEIEADYMWGLLHPSLLTGEGGYYLTSLSSAVLVLKNFREMQETKTTHQEGKLPSISDMQGFLKIAIPDELRDTIVWRTLPVRPNMTTKDVCCMIAHKFKITNPQDYGLYLLENGEESKLTDTESPQGRKAELLSNKKDCVFAYKRTAANIAWPKSLK